MRLCALIINFSYSKLASVIRSLLVSIKLSLKVIFKIIDWRWMCIICKDRDRDKASRWTASRNILKKGIWNMGIDNIHIVNRYKMATNKEEIGIWYLKVLPPVQLVCFSANSQKQVPVLFMRLLPYTWHLQHSLPIFSHLLHFCILFSILVFFNSAYFSNYLLDWIFGYNFPLFLLPYLSFS